MSATGSGCMGPMKAHSLPPSRMPGSIEKVSRFGHTFGSHRIRLNSGDHLVSRQAIVLFLLILSMVSSLACAADTDVPFILISDVDDTVKISHVLGGHDALVHASQELVFAGMPELYQGILGDKPLPKRLRFLSGSPFVLHHHIEETLDEAKFPPYKLTIRGPTDLVKTVGEYKTKNLDGLYADSSDHFLLIGDDTESDPAVYVGFTATKPDLVIGIYIHRMAGKPLPSLPPSRHAFLLGYVTAYDIAMHEFMAGRLSKELALKVGGAVWIADDSTLLPEFQRCPQGSEIIAGLVDDRLLQIKNQIDERISSLCTRRANATSVHKESGNFDTNLPVQ